MSGEPGRPARRGAGSDWRALARTELTRTRIDPAGVPFIAAALVLGAVCGLVVSWAVAAGFVVLAGFFLFFFRDPDRQPDRDAPGRSEGERDAVLAPADGRVLVAGPAIAEAAPPGAWQQISIFLSPLDVHVNRVPVGGRVTRVGFTRGRFLPAYREEAAKVNEQSEVWIEHDGQAIVARQVVGVLARRVVCRLQAGVDVRAGQRFGVMKFGSRMDVFVPLSATLSVRVGEKVRAGETVIAVLH